MTVKERIDGLKSLKTIANNYLSFYKSLSNRKTKSWIHAKSENSIIELKEIISRIKKDLHPQSLELYCKPLPQFEGVSVADVLSNKKSAELDTMNERLTQMLEQANLNFTFFDIIRLAPEQNIIHDITWLTDGTVRDYIDVALGDKNIKFFELYLPSKIQETQKRLIPDLQRIDGFSEKVTVIQEAIENSKKEKFLVSNILLNTVIESIVRELCKFVYQKQNPSYSKEKIEDFVYNRFNSLDTLISKAEWKNDYPVSIAEALTTYKDVSEPYLNGWRIKWSKHVKANRKIMQITKTFRETLEVNMGDNEFLHTKSGEYLKSLEEVKSNLLSDEDFQIKIGISVMLNFLIRKYKDDRNLIIHGNFQSLNHKWKNYINFSALIKVFDTYTVYNEFYLNEERN